VLAVLSGLTIRKLAGHGVEEGRRRAQPSPPQVNLTETRISPR
jgi:hypothetical protein